MKTYFQNSVGEFVGCYIGSEPQIFDTEDEAYIWGMEYAPTLVLERWKEKGYKLPSGGVWDGKRPARARAKET